MITIVNEGGRGGGKIDERGGWWKRREGKKKGGGEERGRDKKNWVRRGEWNKLNLGLKTQKRTSEVHPTNET